MADPKPVRSSGAKTAATASIGDELHALAARLYPICRSITGAGVRQSLRLIGERIPLAIREIPSGSAVYDWEVPLEWNIEDASLLAPGGERIIDFRAHNLHIVSYSEPYSGTVSLDELQPRLHSLPAHPGWIPYRTSYYRRSWGFCLRDQLRKSLVPGKYRVEIRSSLAPGSLTYGELAVPGRRRDEVLFFTHVCHPSLANDNVSGMAVTTALAQWIASAPRRYSYRFVFAPGTIGSLCWLKQNERRLANVRTGLVLGLLGDPGALTYKMSRNGNTRTDTVASYVLEQLDPAGSIMPFSPYGYDERQLCSPGFDLPIGRLTRSANSGYPQYHSSADDLDLIRPQYLAHSLEACKLFVTVLEEDGTYINRCPKGEPQLGKRGLYGAVGGASPGEREHAMLWILNQSDGSKSLLDIARRSGLRFELVRDAAAALEHAALLRASPSSTLTAGTASTAREQARGMNHASGLRPASRRRQSLGQNKRVKP
jgi:aminopeptidase-like protein